MLQRNIQGLEIVPFIFNLGAIGHRETESPHDSLELFNGLRDRVQTAPPQDLTGQRRVKPFGLAGLRRSVARAQSLLGSRQDLFDAAP